MTYGGFCSLAVSKVYCSFETPSTSSFTPSTVEMASASLSPSGNCHASKCVLTAAALVLGGAAVGYAVGYVLASKRARTNLAHQLGCDKVVDTVDVEDIGEKKVYCRCWKSEKFPYCDGSHNKHNKDTGDNLGPLIVKGKSPVNIQ